VDPILAPNMAKFSRNFPRRTILTKFHHMFERNSIFARQRFPLFRDSLRCPQIKPRHSSGVQKKEKHFFPASFRRGLGSSKAFAVASLAVAYFLERSRAQNADPSDVSCAQTQMARMQKQYEDRISSMSPMRLKKERKEKKVESKADSGRS